MFKLFLNVVIVFLIFLVEVAYVNCIKGMYDDYDALLVGVGLALHYKGSDIIVIIIIIIILFIYFTFQYPCRKDPGGQKQKDKTKLAGVAWR